MPTSRLLLIIASLAAASPSLATALQPPPAADVQDPGPPAPQPPIATDLQTPIVTDVPPSGAADDKPQSSGVEIHAFVSQGYVKTIRNNYLVAKTKKNGSFDATEVGINFTKTLADHLRVGVQLFAGGYLGTDRYDFNADWFYLDYRWRDWLGLRAGRVKLPFGLYNEINDVDAARVPILLPQSTYPVANRNLLLAQTGFELYGYLGSDRAGALEYRLYGGTILIDAAAGTTNPMLTLRNIKVPHVIGGRLMWEMPVEGLRIGGSAQYLRLDTDAQTPTGLATLKIPAFLWIASVEYNFDKLLLASEYSRWRTALESSDPAIYPATPAVTAERFYAMVAYRLGPWLQVGSYYSLHHPNTGKRTGRAYYQHDVAGTLRFDLTPNWLVKLEAHYMQGTAGLNRLLNDRPLADLSSRWAVFLLKTTAYF